MPADAPVAPLYVPGSAGVHIDDPVPAWYVPTPHGSHSDAAVAENVPTPQSSAAVAPSPPVNVPAVVRTHVVWPLSDW